MSLNKAHAGDEYFNWVMALSDHLQTFGVDYENSYKTLKGGRAWGRVGI